MTKQIIRDVEKCFECPFIEWDYLPNGNVYQYCGNGKLREMLVENKTIENINAIPIWCPLPDKKD